MSQVQELLVQQVRLQVKNRKLRAQIARMQRANYTGTIPKWVHSLFSDLERCEGYYSQRGDVVDDILDRIEAYFD